MQNQPQMISASDHRQTIGQSVKQARRGTIQNLTVTG
jgi:hypothetical protein